MEQPKQIPIACPRCSIPIVCMDSKIPSHGKVVGEEIQDCDAAPAGKHFVRSYSKPANREKKGK